jgi:hypothetical protein
MTASLSEILREETLRKAKCSDRVAAAALSFFLYGLKSIPLSKTAGL